MSSRDPKNENSIIHDTDGSGATWLIAVLVIVAVIGGMYLYGGDDASVTDDMTPAATEETAPIADPVIEPTETLPAE